MKSFIFALVICAAGSFGAVQAQECSSGQCRTPVRNVAVATADVVRDVVSVPVAVVQHVATTQKQVVHRAKRFVVRARKCGCGCCR